MRDKVSKLEILMSKLSKEKIKNVIVTVGSRRSILYAKKLKSFLYGCFCK